MSRSIIDEYIQIRREGDAQRYKQFLDKWFRQIMTRANNQLWRVAAQIIGTTLSLTINRKEKELKLGPEKLAFYDELIEIALKRFGLEYYFDTKQVRVGDMISCKNTFCYRVIEILGPKEVKVLEISERGLDTNSFPITLKGDHRLLVGVHLPENYIFTLPTLTFIFFNQ